MSKQKAIGTLADLQSAPQPIPKPQTNVSTGLNAESYKSKHCSTMLCSS